MSTQPLLQRTANKRIAIPVRVEPKVAFANERTFLSWLHFTVVLGGLAVGLLNFGDRVRLSAPYIIDSAQRWMLTFKRYVRSGRLARGCSLLLVRQLDLFLRTNFQVDDIGQLWLLWPMHCIRTIGVPRLFVKVVVVPMMIGLAQ